MTAETIFPFVAVSSLELKPQKWLIKGLIPEDSQGDLIGPSEVGKSFLAVDIACCVATGTAFHGLQIKHCGPVFYIAGEGHNGLARRFKAWEIAKSKKVENIYLSEHSCSLSDPNSIESVVRAIKGHEGEQGSPALVIIDTLARNFGDGDENNTQDMGKVVDSIDSIRRAFDCTVLTVHHTGYEGTRGRGSTALKGASDFQFLFDNIGGVKVLRPLKTKDDKPPEMISFKFIEVQLGIRNEDGEEERSAILERNDAPVFDRSSISKTQQSVLKVFQTEQELQSSPAEIARMLNDLSKENVEKALQKLYDLGYLERPSRGLYQLSRKHRKNSENQDIPERGINGPESEIRKASLDASDFPKGNPNEPLRTEEGMSETNGPLRQS